MGGGVNPPPEVIASWPTPNYVNPETRGEGIAVMEYVLLAVCFAIVACLRVWTRAFQSKSFGLDDALIMFNLIPLTGMAVGLALALTRYGWNRHIWDIPIDMLYAARKVSLTIQTTYLWSTCTTKVSILLFYRRLTARISTPFRITVYAAIGFVVCFVLSGTIALLLGCRPLHAYWLSLNPVWKLENQGTYTCYDEGTYIIVVATISMVTDFLVCLLPMTLFMRLKIARRQKFALAAIFGVGFFLCICGVLRMVKIVRTYYYTYDITDSCVEVWIWTAIEAHCAVICASVPALNHLFRSVLKESSLVSRLRSLTPQFKSRGYGRTQSRSNSEYNGKGNEYSADKKAIHVVQEVRLEEFLRDKQYDTEAGRGKGRGSRPIDEESKKPRAWLDDETSSDESIRNAPAQPSTIPR